MTTMPEPTRSQYVTATEQRQGFVVMPDGERKPVDEYVRECVIADADRFIEASRETSVMGAKPMTATFTGVYVACAACDHPPAQPPKNGHLSISADPGGRNVRMTPHYAGCDRGVGGCLLPVAEKGRSLSDSGERIEP